MAIRVLVPEAKLRIAQDLLFVNPLLEDDPLLHLADEVPAYVDGDGRYRVNSAAVLHRPADVCEELAHIGNGRWTQSDVLVAIQGADRYIRDALATLPR